MIKSNSLFARKLKDMVAVKEFANKLHCKNKLLAIILMDNSLIPDSDIVRYQIYEDISKELIGQQNIHIYKLTDDSVRVQIGTLVRELSYKSLKQAEYLGLVVIEVPDDVVEIEEYRLLFEFLEEQNWYTVISARKNVDKIYKALSKSIFVDICKLKKEDLEIISLSDIFKEQYNICLSKCREKEIYDYLSTLRLSDSDISYEHVFIHQMAYNLILNAIENENKSLKINDVSELTKGFEVNALKKDSKVKIGFDGYDITG